MKYLDKLKSTTWEGRNIDNLNSLFTHVDKENIDISQKKTLIIGPGGIVNLFSWMLPKGPKKNITKIKRLQYIILRQIESALRKTGKLELKSFEIIETLNLLQKGETKPNCLYVADCEQKILDTIKNTVSDIEIKPLLRDIENGKANETFDIIICYNVIQRLNQRKKGLKSVINSISDDGLLSLDIGKLSLDEGFFGVKKISDNLYQKINRDL